MRFDTLNSASRRQFLAAAGATLFSAPLLSAAQSTSAGWKPKYLLPSCMYGELPLATIAREIEKIGAVGIDIWPKVHGNQREQLDEMGEEKFLALLKQHNTTLECITQYKLGPFGIQDEMRLAKRLGCSTIVTGAKGPKGLSGSELKSAVKTFIEQMQPHLAVAAETGVTIAIENHANSLVETPDSLRYLAELTPTKHLAVALAPYHLPQEPELLASLLRELGDSVAMFYAWQHGRGCHEKLPKAQELLQMPGRGDLDFAPLWETLASMKYAGWVEIFMHPVPRGIPILPTAEEVTAEINRARKYLAGLES